MNPGFKCQVWEDPAAAEATLASAPRRLAKAQAQAQAQAQAARAAHGAARAARAAGLSPGAGLGTGSLGERGVEEGLLAPRLP